MINHKKFIFALIFGMSVFAFAGCGSNSDGNDASQESASTEENTQESIDDEVDYSIFTGDFSDCKSGDASCKIEMGEDKDCINIEITINNIDQDHPSRLGVWKMTATYSQPENKIEYDECSYEEHDGDKIVEEKTLGSGFFSWDDLERKIVWAGANDSKYKNWEFKKKAEQMPDGEESDQ